MSPLVVTVELDLDGDGSFTEDITAYCRVKSGINITRGRQDEQSAAAPARCELAVNNKDGRFSPRNPSGPYYGQIKRNTALRVTTAITGADPSIRFVGEVAAWPITWEKGEADVWVDITAAGIRRRLSQGQEPLRDPLERASIGTAGTLATDRLGYWPMGDTSGNFLPLAGTALLAAGAPIDYADVDEAFPGLPALPTFQGGSAYALLPASSTGTITAGALVFMPSGLGGVIHTLLLIQYSGGSVGFAEVAVLANTGQLQLALFDHSGAFIVGATTGVVDNILDRPVRIQMWVDQNGANVDMSLSVIDTDGTANLYTDSASTLTLGTPIAVGIGTSGPIGSRAALLGVSVGNLLVASAAVDPNGLYQAMTGYVGELADARIGRLCSEEAISCDEGPGGLGVPLGQQTTMSLLALLDEAALADGGILTEFVDQLGFVYTPRASLYDQDISVDLAYTALEELRPVEDDQRIVNDLTLTREGGSTYRYVQDEGPLTPDAPPEGIGRYDSSLTLSLADDDQLEDQASWRVHVGTVDEARYPDIGFDLIKATNPFSTAVVEAVQLLREGDAFRVTDPPTFAGTPDDIRQLVAGWREDISHAVYRVTLIGVPASPYDVGVYSDTGTYLELEPGTRWSGSEAAAITEDLDTTETGINFTDPGGNWSASDQPFYIDIGGEQMRVTAISGSGAQVFTVVRSINGVVKTHANGAQVRLWQPAAYAL